MLEYRDRGIIKWAPFDALISYQNVLSEMRYERNKTDKPILSDDQYETLNCIVRDAMKHQKTIHITYYEKGYFKLIFGVIKTYDVIKNTLVFREGFCIETQQIIDASIDL